MKFSVLENVTFHEDEQKKRDLVISINAKYEALENFDIEDESELNLALGLFGEVRELEKEFVQLAQDA